MPAGELASCGQWLLGGTDGRVQEVDFRRLTDRASSCRPPVTLPWSTDGRPRVSPTDAGGRRLGRPRAPRPAPSNALFSGCNSYQDSFEHAAVTSERKAVAPTRTQVGSVTDVPGPRLRVVNVGAEKPMGGRGEPDRVVIF